MAAALGALGPMAASLAGGLGTKLFGGLMGGGPDTGWLQDVAKKQQSSQGDAWNQLQGQLGQVRGTMDPYMTANGQGFNPLQLALMKSSFLNGAADNYGTAHNSVIAALARRGSGGGQGPVGGEYTRGMEGLEGAQADTVSKGLMGIDMSNLEQALRNKFAATGMLQGNAGMFGQAMNTFTNGMDSAMGNYTKAMSIPTGTNQFMQGFGGTLGTNLAKAMGGAGKSSDNSNGQ